MRTPTKIDTSNGVRTEKEQNDKTLYEEIMKREDQQDATIRCLLLTSVSTCFGHHYAHLQQNKDRVLLHTVYCAGSAGCGW